MSLDAMEFRRALGAYPTGVTVVTTKDAQGVPRGFTANSFTSVSLTPPLVLVCLAKAAHSHEVFTNAATFAINVLAESQKAISSLFASKQPDKFESCKWHTGDTGVPLIDGAVARFDCRVHSCVDAGDHTILIGEVQALHHAADERPLGYCRGAYVSYQSEQLLAATAAPSTRVFGLIETQHGVVLLQDEQGRYSLPMAARPGAAAGKPGLVEELKAMGVHATLDFVFSVYEDEQGTCVVYRGRADTPQRAQLSKARLVPLEELPDVAAVDDATASMLSRYARERREDAFGIYVGDASQGDVRPLSLRAA
jgi:flavin reductase (DIM6/NTAB) family NADH-FMN oxidoreductase RutF